MPWNANGADPKVDPTLTGAWPFPKKGTWRPVSLPSGPDPRTGFVGLCHRCSHRHPVPSGGWSGSEDPFRPPGGSETGLPGGSSPLVLQRPAEAFRCQPLAKRRERPADGCVASRSWLVALLRTEVLNTASLKTARTVAAISIRFEFLSSFSPLGPSDPKFPPRLDDLKLPLAAESRKLARGRLSTVHAFACGHRWITQRFVASYLSRCASNRNRSALSLMNPCASV